MYHFNIILTEMCNANCSHCYMSSGVNRKKETLSQEQIDLIIDKLPMNTISVTLTGGEIFLIKDLLEYTIKKIKTKIPTSKIELESNGIYIYMNNTQEILENLKKLGVDSIRFSLDPFHKEGGVDLEKVKNLKKKETLKTPTIKFLIQQKALAIGKAKNLPIDKVKNMNCMNSEKTLAEPYFFLDIRGYVYICTWKCIPPLGNIFIDDFDTILNSLKTTFFKNILCGKILDAINIIKENDDNINIINACGECYLCDKIFKEDNYG